MKRNQISEVVKWWKPYQNHRKNQNHFFEPPACELSEIRFLTFLIYLEKEKITPATFVAPIILYSHDQVQQTYSIALQKRWLKKDGIDVDFGTFTRLVLTGELAGTITTTHPTSSTSPTSQVAIRPLLLTPDFSRPFLRQILISKKYQEFGEYKIRLELLNLAQTVIQQKGSYGLALIHLLQVLNIPADIPYIERNSETFKTLITQKK